MLEQIISIIKKILKEERRVKGAAVRAFALVATLNISANKWRNTPKISLHQPHQFDLQT